MPEDRAVKSSNSHPCAPWWIARFALATMAPITYLAVVASGAVAQSSLSDPATGLSVTAPPGYQATVAPLRGNYTAVIDVKHTRERDTGCKVAFQPSPQNERFSQIELNSLADKPAAHRIRLLLHRHFCQMFWKSKAGAAAVEGRLGSRRWQSCLRVETRAQGRLAQSRMPSRSSTKGTLLIIPLGPSSIWRLHPLPDPESNKA
jgi:hypothetical protein